VRTIPEQAPPPSIGKRDGYLVIPGLFATIELKIAVKPNDDVPRTIRISKLAPVARPRETKASWATLGASPLGSAPRP
jgi:hypothetical protein